jgi:hypothetical protein
MRGFRLIGSSAKCKMPGISCWTSLLFSKSAISRAASELDRTYGGPVQPRDVNMNSRQRAAASGVRGRNMGPSRMSALCTASRCFCSLLAGVDQNAIAMSRVARGL